MLKDVKRYDLQAVLKLSSLQNLTSSEKTHIRWSKVALVSLRFYITLSAAVVFDDFVPQIARVKNCARLSQFLEYKL